MKLYLYVECRHLDDLERGETVFAYAQPTSRGQTIVEINTENYDLEEVSHNDLGYFSVTKYK